MAVLTSTTAKRNAWINYLGHCRGGVFVNQLFFGKTVGGVADVWADAVIALEQAFRAGGYTPKSAWAYVFRGIAGAICTCDVYGKCSLHGGQGAIDIDPKENPYITTSTFRWSDTKFTSTQIALVEGIKNTKGEQMWFWGGRWITIKDYMHFEPNVDPGSAEVDWNTVPGGKPTTGLGDDDMPLLPIRYGHGYENPPADSGLSGDQTYKEQDVILLQNWLHRCGWDKKIDGVYGNDTAAGVIAHGALAGSADGRFVSGWVFDNIQTKAIGIQIAAAIAKLPSAGGITEAKVDLKIAAHAKLKASSGVHPHGHDEGQTGPAI